MTISFEFFRFVSFFAQNIDCGNMYPRSMFLINNKKKKVYPCKTQFFYIKVGCKGM